MQSQKNGEAKRERMTADRRQAAILDASERLLMTQGWEHVTINDILAAAGISRGGFYHHFNSKDDILATLVLRFADASTAWATTSTKTAGGDILTRLSAFLSGALNWEIDHAEEVMSIVRLARRSGNTLLFLELGEETARRTRPALIELLTEGVESGTFVLADIDLTADLFLRIARTRWLDAISAQDVARSGAVTEAKGRLRTRIKAEQQSFERLLGISEGRLTYPPEDSFDHVLL